jgi:hypothetical protein
MLQTYVDLCTTCNRESNCVNRSAPDTQVFECEDFTEHEGVKRTFPENRFRPHATVSPNGKTVKGLCGDCLNRKNCSMVQMLEGGVWHCEEYR